MADHEFEISPRENIPESIPEITPIEELEASEAAGTLSEPEESLGSVLLEAAAPGVDEAVETVADAASALSDATPEDTVEGAIPLSQVPVRGATQVGFKMIAVVGSEAEAKAAVADLPSGSFYKKNPTVAHAEFRVYKSL